MSKKEELLKKLLSHPKDFTFDEMKTLLEIMGYSDDTKGKTSGSRVKFYNSKQDIILLHKPHPRNTLLSYQIRDIVNHLKREGLL